MESNIPKYDLPVDYIVGEGFAKDLLKSYKNFPCKIESGLFILCIKGTMEVTINTNTHHISENDLITLPPNCILEVHTFSSDIQIYYAGFSSHFIESINLMKATQHLLPVIMENPIVALSPLQACSYKMFYESSILSYASLRTRENKEIVKAVLTMFIQGATEIYKLQNNWYLSSQSRKYEIYQEFLKLVMKHYTIHHGTSFYADELGNHTIFRHANFIGCLSADKIKMPVRKYFCFNIPVYRNMAEEPSCRSPYHEEYIQTSVSGNSEGLCRSTYSFLSERR